MRYAADLSFELAIKHTVFEVLKNCIGQIEKENNGSLRLSPTQSGSNLSLRPCRYLSTVTRSSIQGSVDGFRRERLQRLTTFDSLSVQRHLEAK